MADLRRGRYSWQGSAIVGAVIVVAYVGVDFTRSGTGAGTVTTDTSLSLGASARADFDYGDDTDRDGLSDEFEPYCGGSVHSADTDYDGYGDGAEWVLGSDLCDRTSVPDARPAVRSYAYEAEGQVRVFCAVYPADLDLIGSFHLLIGSQNFGLATDGDPGSGIGIYDVSGMLVDMVGAFTESSYLGLSLVGFEVNIERQIVIDNEPMNIAWAARLADVVVTDQLYIGLQSANGYLLACGPGLAGGGGSFSIQPLAAISPPGGEESEYCAVSLSPGSPVGLASVEYSVTSAGCAPDGLLYCLQADCSALSGQTFVVVDYGYLQSKAQ